MVNHQWEEYHNQFPPWILLFRMCELPRLKVLLLSHENGFLPFLVLT